MSAENKFSSAAAEAAAAKMEQCATAIRDRLDYLEQSVMQKAYGAWQADSASDILGQVNNYVRAAASIHTNIVQVAKIVQNADKNYIANEQNNEDIMANTLSQFG